MILDVVWLIVGLVCILVGANYLTDGSSALARRFGLSDLVVGLTVVAFGTSTPELVISVMAAINGSAPLAVGNVVGSNIFNILMIIGATAIVSPLVIKKSVMTGELPMLLLSSLILLMLGAQTFLNDSASNIVSRTDGLFLLLLFYLFIRYTVSKAKSSAGDDDPEGAPSKGMPLWRMIVFILGGLVGLVWGGDKFVEGATGLARGMGVSDAIIGLTIVAAGTSLPELAASIVAAVKGKPGLAIGNVIGSNIFNVLLVLGAASVVHPLPFGEIGLPDLLTLLGASILFIFFGWAFKVRTITRLEGALMVLCYVAYTAYLITIS